MNDNIRELENIDIKKVKKFDFNNFKTLAKCINVHDTDTITIIYKYNNEYYKSNIRLSGIDSPELKSSNIEESNWCKEGKAYLESIILNKIINVNMGKFDKYGRILGYIYTLNNECINDLLISKSYVRAYDGGHKKEWTSDELKNKNI
jgi:endonuclease YncB( thermonuclease family)